MITWALSQEYVLIWVALEGGGAGVRSREGERKVLLNTNSFCSHVPVLDGVEGLLVGDVKHEDETHGPAVVGRGDGTVSLLTSCVLETKPNMEKM